MIFYLSDIDISKNYNDNNQSGFIYFVGVFRR